MKRASILIALAVAWSQQPLPDHADYKPASDADAAQLEKAWLHTDNPRLIAWGAYLAASDSRRELVPAPPPLPRLQMTH